ncbi:MAG TPA: hypothetical protein VKQ32_03990 [Polyangia bacterium]|nr:hypothetical protein [Polyangia bacterium]
MTMAWGLFIVKLEFLFGLISGIGMLPTQLLADGGEGAAREPDAGASSAGDKTETPTDSPILRARVVITEVPPVFNEKAQGELQSMCNHTYLQPTACSYVVPIAGVVLDAPPGATVLLYMRSTDKRWYLQPEYDRFDVMIKGGFKADVSPGTDYAAVLVGGRRPKMIGVEPTSWVLAYPRSYSDKRRGPPRSFVRLPEVGDKLPPFANPVLAVDVKKGLSERAWRRLEDRRARKLQRSRH